MALNCLSQAPKRSRPEAAASTPLEGWAVPSSFTHGASPGYARARVASFSTPGALLMWISTIRQRIRTCISRSHFRVHRSAGCGQPWERASGRGRAAAARDRARRGGGRGGPCGLVGADEGAEVTFTVKFTQPCFVLCREPRMKFQSCWCKMCNSLLMKKPIKCAHSDQVAGALVHHQGMEMKMTMRVFIFRWRQ